MSYKKASAADVLLLHPLPQHLSLRMDLSLWLGTRHA